jgi:hypothetical protein
VIGESVVPHITLGECRMNKPYLKFLLDFSGEYAYLNLYCLKVPRCIQNPTSPQEAHFEDHSSGISSQYFLSRLASFLQPLIDFLKDFYFSSTQINILHHLEKTLLYRAGMQFKLADPPFIPYLINCLLGWGLPFNDHYGILASPAARDRSKGPYIPFRSQLGYLSWLSGKD